MPSVGQADHVDLANIIDAKPQHREALKPIANANRHVSRRVAAKMPDDLVRKDGPSENLIPPAVMFHLESPDLGTHGVFGRNDLHRPFGKEQVDRFMYFAGHVPAINAFSVIDPENFSLMERL